MISPDAHEDGFTYRLKIDLNWCVRATPRASSGQGFVQKWPQGTGVPEAHSSVE